MVLSRASSLGEFEMVDPEPAPEVESAVDESGLTADSEEDNCESDVESEFEDVMPQAEVAKDDSPSEAEHHQESSSPQNEEEVGSEDDSLLDDIESVASETPEASPTSEADITAESSDTEADIQLDNSDYTATSDSVASSEMPQANPDREVGPSTRARRRRSMAPANVTRAAATLRQNAKEGLAEAVRLINCVDSRLDKASPHVVDGVTYFKQQVHDDFHGTAKDMRDAFGEDQESEPTVAATFSHFKAQFKNDFKNIRKDVDSAFGCLLGSTESHHEAAAGWASEEDCRAIPAATCSIVSMAVASWLVPVRLARFAVANLAT